MPQGNVMRALLRAAHQWVDVEHASARQPASACCATRRSCRSKAVGFPAIPGVSDPRTIEGPGLIRRGHFTALPFLVPRSMLTATRSPAFACPNSRCRWRPRPVGTSEPSASAIRRRSTRCSGSYVPFARTKAERDARHDPRPSIEERYRDRDDYLQKIRASAAALVKDRLLLQEDVDDVVQRATKHWAYATRDDADELEWLAVAG